MVNSNFGGTETGSEPFLYDKDNGRVTVSSNHIGGERVVRISSGITQKFNITGKELFQSVIYQGGNLNSSEGVGIPQTDSMKIYDADGNEYDLNLTYIMTGPNKYDLSYSITDEESNVIVDDTVNDIMFSSETGEFLSIGSDTFGEINIQNTENKIDFVIDLNRLSEKDAAASIRSSLSQKADIFNTLISIRDQLNNGEKPSSQQVEIVNDFYKHLLNKLSAAGGITNKLDATADILTNRELEISELLSLEKDVDIAQALIELESAQYTLDISYQISSMILPKSLMDYL